MRVVFGDCTFDSETRELFRGAAAVRLSPKAFRLLELLIENRPRALSKQELQEKLWPKTFVSEANLASLAAEARRAIGDTARGSRLLRTVYGFGYAFSGEATIEDLGSKNGTFLEGKRVGTRPLRLSAGDEIQIGSVFSPGVPGLQDFAPRRKRGQWTDEGFLGPRRHRGPRFSRGPSAPVARMARADGLPKDLPGVHEHGASRTRISRHPVPPRAGQAPRGRGTDRRPHGTGGRRRRTYGFSRESRVEGQESRPPCLNSQLSTLNFPHKAHRGRRRGRFFRRFRERRALGLVAKDVFPGTAAI